MSNVVKFPPPRRFNVEDRQDERGNWTVWEIVEITGSEAIVYIEGDDDPWAGDTIEKIIENASNYEYGYADSDEDEIHRVNSLIMSQAIKIQHNTLKPEKI